MDPTLAEIRIFAGTFAPQSWAFCNGQLMSISQNTALFALIGTTYGGDGQTTFALPDLRSRVAVGTGQGPGLSTWDLGEVQGTESVTLLSINLPAHNHTVANISATPFANAGPGTTNVPSGYMSSASLDFYASSGNALGGATPINSPLGVAGGNTPHENRQPFLALNFIIAIEGIFPSRN